MYSIGVDIGSTAAKAVVVEGGEIVCTLVVPTGFSGVDAAGRLAESLRLAGYVCDGAPVVATGYGRVSVPYAQRTVTEITCHGIGGAYLFGPEATIIDIGGQDTKAIRLDGGKVAKFAMNDKCSAGTGKFLEVMANRLGVAPSELTMLARVGKPTPITSMCTVFAESEVITLIGNGAAREDIARGVVDSVVSKVVPLITPVGGGSFALTGGLCEEDFILERLSDALGSPVRTCALARYAGALGAALEAQEEC